MSENQPSNKVFDSQKMAAHLYWNGAMLYFNATIGEKWKDIDFYGDWEAQFSSFLMDEADLIARHVAKDRIDPHAESLADHFERLKTACFGEGGLNTEAAISHLGKIGYHGAQVMAAREVAHHKIKSSKELIGKLRKGREQSPRAKRKQFALHLYAQTRPKTSTPHEAAKRLLDEITRNAIALGEPLSVDRAFETIYEWFREYDEQHPR